MKQYVCGICGYVYEGAEAPDKCPQCGAAKEIADTLGFSDQSAFGKFFARQTGCSPLRFRRERATR